MWKEGGGASLGRGSRSQNTFRRICYRLPSAVSFGRSDEVALAGLSIYNSTFNVTAARGNNTFTITWQALNASLLKANTVTFTIPDVHHHAAQRLHSATDVQSGRNRLTWVYLPPKPRHTAMPLILSQSVPSPTQQSILRRRALSLGGVLVLFLAVSSHHHWLPSRYSCGRTHRHSNTLGFLQRCQQLQHHHFQQLPHARHCPHQLVQLVYHDAQPAQQPVQHSLGRVFHHPSLSGLGQVIIVNPSQFLFNDIAPNIYNSIILRFFDQNFNAITLNDTQLTITLAIQEAGK